MLPTKLNIAIGLDCCSSSGVFVLNPQQDPRVNLVVILVGIGVLVVWGWVSDGVYGNWQLDALESSFALNLAAATYHVTH